MTSFLHFLDPARYPLLEIPAWLLFLYLIACLLGGWLQLLDRFCWTGDPVGETREAHSANRGFDMACMRWWVGIPALRLAAAEDALYLSARFPFTVLYSPLRIPWGEVDCSMCQYMFRDFVVLTLGREEQIPLRISPRVARQLGLQTRFPKSVTLPVEPNFDKLDNDFAKSLEQKPH